MRVLLGKLARYVVKRLSKSSRIDGLWVAAGDMGQLAKVRDAIMVIKTRDPRRYARIVTDLDGIWVTLLPGPIGQFSADDLMCELDERFVARSSSERIASVIVHEATHARLWRRGIRYAEDIRKRVETVCLRQQQAFEAKLAAPGMTADELGRYLDQPADAWTDETLRQSNRRGAVEALRHLKVPGWLILFVLRCRRSLIRRQRRAAR